MTDFARETYHPVEMGDILLAKQVSEHLEKHYPGWGWMVHVNSEQGIVDITNAILAAYGVNTTYAFTVIMDNLRYEDEIKRWSIRAGGELIERMHQPRGPVKNADPVTKVDGVPNPFAPKKRTFKVIT